MIRWLQLAYYSWRYVVLEGQVANGEALMRDHRLRLEAAQGELATVERRLNVLKLTGDARPLLIEALKRRNAA